MPNSNLRKAGCCISNQGSIIIPLYCNRNSKHLRRPFETYLTKFSSQNAEPFLIAEITPNM